MSLLHLHTQLLESFGWDEEETDEAVRRAIEVHSEILSSGTQPTAYTMKKRLKEEYSEERVDNMILFFEACQRFKEELKKDAGEIDD